MSAMEQLPKPISALEPLNSPTAPKSNLSNPNSNHQSGDRQWLGYRDCVSSQSMLHNFSNFKNSQSPSRLLQWIGGSWIELAGEFLSVAKSAFSDRRPIVEVEIGGNHCILDFYRMLRFDVDSGLQRSIAWIDVNGGCFFPKFFVDESLIDDDDEEEDADNESENPVIEVEIKINKTNINNNNNNTNIDNDDNRKRKVRDCDDEVDTADSSCSETGNSKRRRMVPLTWQNARLLGQGERSFMIVRDLFMAGMRKVDPGVKITSIRQFTRSGLGSGLREKARWEVFHKQMAAAKVARGRSNAVFAWHGASKRGVLGILAHGFGRPSDVPGSLAHGVGVYLSPARMSLFSDLLSEADDNGEKHLVLCRVILGNIEKVEVGSQQFHPSSPEYDSGTDDLVNPKWYVVWSTKMNTHILPECVVSYKNSHLRLGRRLKEVDCMNWIPKGSSTVLTKLFSKLGSSLPAVKLEELKVLCLTFKAGRMAKDSFIMQLKSVVGNEVLRSAISEIQCAN